MLVSSSDIFSVGKQTLMNRKQNVYGDGDADCQWLDNGSCRCLLTSVPVWWHFPGPPLKGCVTLCLLYQSNIPCCEPQGPGPYRTLPTPPLPLSPVCLYVSLHPCQPYVCGVVRPARTSPVRPQPSSSNIILDSLPLPSPSVPSLRLNEETKLPWIMKGDLCVLWCEHWSGSHYAPIRTDHGFREESLHLLCPPLLFLSLMQTMPESLLC